MTDRPIVEGDLLLDEDRGFVYQVMNLDGFLTAVEMRVVPEEAAPELRVDWDSMRRIH